MRFVSPPHRRMARRGVRLSRWLGIVCAALSFAAAQTKPDASAAISRPEHAGKFRSARDAIAARAKAGPIGVLFLGDSITMRWAEPGRQHIWEKFYGGWQPANFGIGGDQTQHVIWRIEQGELDGISPKLVVLLIGTNNTGAHTAAEIAAANRKIVRLIRDRLPKTKVLVLGIFPRGARGERDGSVTDAARADAARRMSIITETNAALATLDDGRDVRYLDLGRTFLGQDGNVPLSIMPDQVHLSNAGYQLWAEAMHPLLTELMRD